MVKHIVEPQDKGLIARAILLCVHEHDVVLIIVFSCRGMVFNYKMWKNVFGMSCTVWHPMDDSDLDVRPAFPSKLTHYQLTLAWVRQVSYFNPSQLMEHNSYA